MSELHFLKNIFIMKRQWNIYVAVQKDEYASHLSEITLYDVWSQIFFRLILAFGKCYSYRI